VKVAFDAELWRWAARPENTWVFVTLPPDTSDDIRDLVTGPRVGFGSVRVRVSIGDVATVSVELA